MALANARLGAFVYVPPGMRNRRAGRRALSALPAARSIYPYTVVLIDDGARAAVIERLDLAAGAFACGVAEVVTGEGADATYASAQFAPADVRVLFTRVGAARPRCARHVG